ncbi:MAG TPA: hypothetical protein VGC67_09785 [Cellulomonas sp.]
MAGSSTATVAFTAYVTPRPWPGPSGGEPGAGALTRVLVPRGDNLVVGNIGRELPAVTHVLSQADVGAVPLAEVPERAVTVMPMTRGHLLVECGTSVGRLWRLHLTRVPDRGATVSATSEGVPLVLTHPSTVVLEHRVHRGARWYPLLSVRLHWEGAGRGAVRRAPRTTPSARDVAAGRIEHALREHFAEQVEQGDEVTYGLAAAAGSPTPEGVEIVVAAALQRWASWRPRQRRSARGVPAERAVAPGRGPGWFRGDRLVAKLDRIVTDLSDGASPDVRRYLRDALGAGGDWAPDSSARTAWQVARYLDQRQVLPPGLVDELRHPGTDPEQERA